MLFDRDELSLMTRNEILEFRAELQAGLRELEIHLEKREETVTFYAYEVQSTPSPPSPDQREP